MKRTLAWILSLLMIISVLPMNVFAQDSFITYSSENPGEGVESGEGSDNNTESDPVVCTHKYDNDCDVDCNSCGTTREVSGHVYDNKCDTDCNVCGTTREVEGHAYDNACDVDCNVCDETRSVADHVYDNGVCTECNVEDPDFEADAGNGEGEEDEGTPVEEDDVFEEEIEEQSSTDTITKYEVATKAELDAAIAAAQGGDTIVLTADIDYATTQLEITKGITLDLGGKTLTTRGRNYGLALKNDNIVVTNGKLNHAGTVAAIKVWNAAEISDLEIDVTGTSSSGNTIDGIVVQQNAAGVGMIKNVKISSTSGQGVDSGIKTYECGNATEPVIGSMESVTIDAKSVGMNISAPCGTATDCNIKGGVSGIEIWIKGTYSASLNLENCTVEGGTQAVYAHDEFSSSTSIVNNGTITLTADEATTFTAGENGVLLETSFARIEGDQINLPADIYTPAPEVTYAFEVVNGEKFESLQEAINSVAEGGSGTITMLTDHVIDVAERQEPVNYSDVVNIIGRDITLNLNGKTLTFDYTNKMYAPTIYTSLYVEDGSLTITGDGKIHNYYNSTHCDASIITVDANATVTIKDGEFINDSDEVMFFTGSSSSATDMTQLLIEDGTFTGVNQGLFGNSPYNTDKQKTEVSGGTFSHDPSDYCAEGFAPEQDSEGNWVVDVDDTTYVAQIGENKYASLQEAVDNAEAGDTIKLLADATGAGVVFDDGDDVIIDLNGYTYTLSESVGSSAQFGTVGFYLWAGSKVTVKNGTINMIKDIADDDYTFFKMFHTYGDLTLTDVTLDCTNGVAYNGTTDVGFLAVESDNGTVAINGATSITNCSALSPETWTVCAYSKGAVTINTTGTIDGVIASYGSDASVAIEAGKFTNSNKEYAQLTQLSSGAIAVTGGTFSEDPSAYLAFGKAWNADTGAIVDGYVIKTADDLLAFADAVNGGNTYEGKTVKLGADIDLTGVEWIPIGGYDASSVFKGIFDGQNHTISNMTITKTDNANAKLRLGLFSNIENAMIKNLTITNAKITAQSSNARGSVLVMTGNTSNTISGITIANSEVNVKSGETGYAAGVIGYTNKIAMSSIKVSNLTLDVEATTTARAAAVTAYLSQEDADASSLDAFELSDVTINAKANETYVGGVAGYMAKGNQNMVGIGITNGTVSGLKITSTATSAGNVGGLIGMSYKVDPQKVSNVDITGLDIDFSGSGSKVGGVIGWDQSVSYNNVTKQGWYDDVHVTGSINEDKTSGSEVGGFVGVSHQYPKIYINCSADVDIVTGNRAGGFVGTPCPNGWSNQTDLYSGCTASGDVTAPVAGGFVGCAWLNNGVNTTLKLENVTATGAVKGSTYAGGLIGYAAGSGGCSNIIIKDSTASESVTGPNPANTAGVVGNSSMASGKFITLDNVTYTVEPSVNPAAAAKIYVAKVGETGYNTLAEAVAAANATEGGATVELLANVTLGEKLTITGNVTISGEYTITRDDAYTGTLFAVSAGAALTLDGGLTIDGANEYVFDSAAYAADLEAFTQVTDGTKYFTPEEGAPVATAYMITTSGTDSVLNLNKVTIKNHYSTNGSGIVSAGTGVTVNLTGATITHNASTSGSGLVVNASSGKWDTTPVIWVNMNEGTVIDGNHVGGNHGVFKVYMGTVFNMYGGSIKNTTGWNSNGVVVGVYWATFNMNGGEICSNSSVYGPNNGRNAAVYGHSAHAITMTGGSICHNTGGSRGGLDAPYADSSSNGTTTITGGYIGENTSYYYKSGMEGYNPDITAGDKLTITGGTFTQDVSQWLAPDNGMAYDEEEGTYTLTQDLYEYNGTAYKTLADVIAAIAGTPATMADETTTPVVKVLASHKISEAAVINTDLILDLNGKSISSTGDVFVVTSGTLTINDSSDAQAGEVNGGTSGVGSWTAVWANGGNVVINGGTYSVGGDSNATDTTHQNDVIYTKNGGTVTINGGTFENDGTVWTLNENDANRGTITVKGGTFHKWNPADNVSEGANTNFVAEGYLAEETSEGVYTVRVDKDELEAKAIITFTNSNTGETVTLKYPSEFCDSLQKLIGTNDYADFVLGDSQQPLLAYAAGGTASNIVMTLYDDIELDAPLYFYDKYYEVAAEYKITLDLNGHKITNAIPETATTFHTIVNNVDLTVIDSVGGGSIQSNSAKGYAIYTEGGKLTVDGAKIVGINNGYAVVTWTDGDSITIEEGTVIEGRGALYIDGGATGTVNGGTFTMTVQTTNNQDNVIYVGGASELTINGGTFTTGEITGAQRLAIAALGTSKVTINGGTFYGLTGDIQSKESASVSVTGGTFTGSKIDYREGTVSLTGGTFSYDPTTWCAEGYRAKDNGDGTWTVVERTIIPKSATLIYEDLIQIRYKYKLTAENASEYGLLIFATAEDAANLDISKAIEVTNLVKFDGGFYGYTDGIPAKNMGDSQFVVGYAKHSDGEYEYTPVVEYSPKIYAKRMVEKEDSKPETKKLCNALMAYGAAAQLYLNYKTNDLMNVGFAEVTYDANVLGDSIFSVDKNVTNGFSAKSATLIFEGAITYRIKYTADTSISSKALFAEYNVKGVTESVELIKDEGGYYAYISGIAAKDMDEPLTVKPYYIDDSGEKIYGAELTYSGYEYSRRTIQNSSNANSIALAKAFAMYVFAADEAISK